MNIILDSIYKNIYTGSLHCIKILPNQIISIWLESLSDPAAFTVGLFALCMEMVSSNKNGKPSKGS